MSIINPNKERDMKVSAFYKLITSWLLPLGFTEVYSNHPCLDIRRFDFSKKGIRVICTNESNTNEFYCTLYADILSVSPCLALQTTTLITVGNTTMLEQHFAFMLKQIKRLNRK